MKTAIENPGMMSLAAGFTDTSTLPVEVVGAAVERLSAGNKSPEHLQYGAPQGRAELRELLTERTKGLDGSDTGITAERTMIGNGSQQLLYLAMQVLCDPGDIVLVERPSYFVLLEMLSGLGVRAIPLPAEENGAFDFDGISSLFRDLRSENTIDRVKAVYTMGYFANPSGVSRTSAEKAGLANVLREHGMIIPILEDAAYRELWFDQPWEAKSVFTIDEFSEFPRLYFGTLTKPFATGLKVGFVHSSEDDIFERMVWLKGHHDFGTTNFNQAVLELIVSGGHLDRFLDSLRPAYAGKMRTLDQALEGSGLRRVGWSWNRSAGGLYIWAKAPEGVSTSLDGDLWKACVKEEVMYVPGGLCIAGKVDSHHVRLSFGVLDHADLEEAASRFARAAQQATPAEASV